MAVARARAPDSKKWGAHLFVHQITTYHRSKCGSELHGAGQLYIIILLPGICGIIIPTIATFPLAHVRTTPLPLFYGWYQRAWATEMADQKFSDGRGLSSKRPRLDPSLGSISGECYTTKETHLDQLQHYSKSVLRVGQNKKYLKKNIFFFIIIMIID